MSGAYRDAGVDTEAAAKAVALIGDLAAQARRPEVFEDVGGFAGLYRIGNDRLLAAATDGVGTKLEIARGTGPLRHGGHRPGGDVRRRRRVHGRGAAVLPRLHRGGQGRARAGGGAGGRGGRGMPPGGLRPAGRRDRRAPRRDARRPVRPGGVLRGLGGRGLAPGRLAGAGGRRADRPRRQRPARERVLPGAPRPARPRPAGASHRVSAGPSATSCWSPARSTRRTCWP